MKQLTLLTLVYLFLQSSSLYASEPPAAGPRSGAIQGLPLVEGKDIRFSPIANAERLSQTRVGQIVQDNQGFMWFGTQYGLNRYDGYTFKVFLHDPANAESLGGVYIYSLFRDRSGDLWIGCDQSLDRFDPSTERFTHYEIQPRDESPVPVTQISQDVEGQLWLATSKGLYQLDPRTGAKRRFQHDSKDTHSLSSSDIKASLEDRTGAFWVATSEGIDKLDSKTGKVALHIARHESRAVFLHEDTAGLLWVTHVSDKGPDILDRKAQRLVPVAGEGEALSNNELRSMGVMLEDRSGTMWIGSRGAGLFRFDRTQGRFIRYRNDPGDPSSLPENVVNSLFEDHEGNVWVGLSGKSPCRFSTKRPQFDALPNPPNTKESPSQSLITSLFADKEGTVWIGSYGALRLWKRGMNTEGSFPAPPLSTIHDVVAMTQDHAGNIWMGTFTGGLKEFNIKTGKLKTFRHDPLNPSSLSSDAVGGLMVSREGILWISTWNGFDRFDSESESFTTYRPETNVAPPLYLSMTEDRLGRIWIGTHYSGLYQFDPSTCRFKVYRHDVSNPKSLSDSRVNSVFIDRSGELWAATQNGLNKFDSKTGMFSASYESDGLAGNAVSCILEDARGKLWMGTNKGISGFDPQTHSFENYMASDGLPGNDMTGWAACSKRPDGELLFGGFDGGVAFHPSKLSEMKWSPPVVLTALRLSGREVNAGTSLLRLPISRSKELSFDHTQDNFSLEFSALSYINPTSTRYRYKLLDLDQDWNLAGSNQRVVTYTRLPIGKYRFLVEAASGRSTWSENGVSLTIRILPPWWATWWVRTTYLLGTAAVFAFLYWYRLRQLRLQYSIRLEGRVDERTRIARELHDTLLQSFQGSLIQMQAARNTFSRRPTQAVQTLDEAITMAEGAIGESREAIQDLRSQPAAQGDLAQLLTVTGQDLARSHITNQEANGNPVVFRVIVEGERQDLDPLLQDEAYRIARELLRNAFRHAHARHIEAQIRYDNRVFRMRIRDDGKGIEPETLNDGGRTGHWGLLGMRERAKRIGAELNFWSGAGAGTEVELSIPSSLAYGATRRKGRFELLRKKKANS